MRKINRKRLAVVAGGTTLAVAGAGVAFAYWSTTGSGSGTASTTAGQDLVVHFTTAGLAPMFPGDAAQALKVTVTNPSTENVYVAGVSAYLTTDKTGCTGADYLLGGKAAPGDAASATALTWTAQELAKSGGQADATSTIQFNDTAANQDACKGAQVTLHYLSN